MFLPPMEQPMPVLAYAANTSKGTHAAQVLTFPNPGAGYAWVLPGVEWSYAGSGTLAGGNLLIQDGNSVTYFQQDITAQGPGFSLRQAIQILPGTSLVITLADGGANVAGSVNAYPYVVAAGLAAGGPTGAPGALLYAMDFSNPNNLIYDD